MDKSNVRHRNILTILQNRNAYSLALLSVVWMLCILLYYFGEIVDFFGWTSLQWQFFYSVHDAHRLLLLIPIIYSGYVFGVKVTVTMSIITVMAFIPRALFISPYPDPLVRMLVFMLIAGVMGYITAVARREYLRRNRLQKLLGVERDRRLSIIEKMEDGVLILGPDYRIRYMNPSMERYFGDKTDSLCHEILLNSDKPCRDICKLAEVVKGATERWEYKFPNGRIYEVLASPFRDSDGVDCQLTIFRDITYRKKSEPADITE